MNHRQRITIFELKEHEPNYHNDIHIYLEEKLYTIRAISSLFERVGDPRATFKQTNNILRKMSRMDLQV